MSPPTLTITSIRRYTSAEDSVTVQTTEHLVRDTGVLLARAGISVSRSKVSRLVRAWTGQLTSEGFDYVEYLAGSLRLSVKQRSAVSDQYRRVIAYSDPTGETAVRNVARGAR